MSVREGRLKHEVTAGVDVQEQQAEIIKCLKKLAIDNDIAIPAHLNRAITTRKKLPRWLTPTTDRRRKENMAGKGLTRPVLSKTPRREREAGDSAEEDEGDDDEERAKLETEELDKPAEKPVPPKKTRTRKTPVKRKKATVKQPPAKRVKTSTTVDGSFTKSQPKRPVIIVDDSDSGETINLNDRLKKSGVNQTN